MATAMPADVRPAEQEQGDEQDIEPAVKRVPPQAGQQPNYRFYVESWTPTAELARSALCVRHHVRYTRHHMIPVTYPATDPSYY